MSETAVPISSWPPPGIKPYYSDDSVCIIHGDCREILPGLEPVDLVLKNSLINSTVSDTNINHETLRNSEEMAGSQGRDRVVLPNSKLAAGADGVILQHFTNGHDESVETARDSISRQGPEGSTKWAVQGRYEEYILSLNDSKRSVREMRSRRQVSYSSQERQSHRQSPGESSGSLRELPQQPTQKTVVGRSQILLLTDPPYGIGYVHGAINIPNATRFAGVAVVGDDHPFDPDFLLSFPNIVLWGSNHYAHRLPIPEGRWLVWDKRCQVIPQRDTSDCEIAWARGTAGNCARMFYHIWDGFNKASERGIPRSHPTQKPIPLMSWCIGFYPDSETILDPFMGSGTTLRAAKDLGRKAIGIEIEEKYCEIAARRMAQEVLDFGKGG